jgi:hypothetical protein
MVDLVDLLRFFLAFTREPNSPGRPQQPDPVLQGPARQRDRVPDTPESSPATPTESAAGAVAIADSSAGPGLRGHPFANGNRSTRLVHASGADFCGSGGRCGRSARHVGCVRRRARGPCVIQAWARAAPLSRDAGWAAHAERAQPGAGIRSPWPMPRRSSTDWGALGSRTPTPSRSSTGRPSSEPRGRAREQPQVSADASGQTAGRLRWASAGQAMATITSHATERPVFPDASRPLTITIR